MKNRCRVLAFGSSSRGGAGCRSYTTAILGPHNRQEISENIVGGFRRSFSLLFFDTKKSLGFLAEIDRRRCLAGHCPQCRMRGPAALRMDFFMGCSRVAGARSTGIPLFHGSHHRRGRVKHGGNWTTAQASPLPHENVNFDGIGPNGHTGMAGRHPKRRGRIVSAIRNPIPFAVGAFKMR